MSLAEMNLCRSCGAETAVDAVRCPGCGESLASTGARRMIGARVLGQYEVLDVLGQGGMSLVYRARHALTGQDVALKILPPELAAFREVRDRFLEEGRALAQLDHPNIVHLYNFGEEDGCFVLAMQLVRGQTWEQRIVEHGRLSWQESVRTAVEVLGGLDFAHGRGIIHRDVKPSNVLLRADDGAATVTDFGIAKVTGSSKLTATGQTMGTVRYMSPEQVRGEKVDLRTDIYSLAVTLYESLVGDTPFDGATHFEIMLKHLNEPPPPPSARGIELPAEVEALLMRGMAKDPRERPASAARYRDDWNALLEGRPLDLETAATAPQRPPTAGEAAPAEPLPAEETGRIAGPRRPPLWAALASVLVVAAGATVLALSRDPGDEAPMARHAAAMPAGDAAPEVHEVALPDGFAAAVERDYAGDQVRVIAAEPVDPDEVRGWVVAGRDRFRAFLGGRGLGTGYADEPMIVVLGGRELLCAPAVHAPRAVPEGCAELEFHYRPYQRAVYMTRSADGAPARVAEAVALATCIHAPLSGCDEAYRDFGNSLAAGQ